MTDRRVIPISSNRAAERKAAVMGTPTPEQPRPEPATTPAVTPADPTDRKRFDALERIPSYWTGREQTRLELAGRAGWAAPTLQRSLDVKAYRGDGRDVLAGDRQAEPMRDPLGEDRLRQLRIATEHFHKAKELERKS